jgi:hypothetical protein
LVVEKWPHAVGVQNAQLPGAAATIAPDACIEIAAHAQVKLAGATECVGCVEVGFAGWVDRYQFVFRPVGGRFGIAFRRYTEQANRKRCKGF